jgi:hypothetical protein
MGAGAHGMETRWRCIQGKKSIILHRLFDVQTLSISWFPVFRQWNSLQYEQWGVAMSDMGSPKAWGCVGWIAKVKKEDQQLQDGFRRREKFCFQSSITPATHCH